MEEMIQTYAKEIVALLVPFITWFLNSSQRQKAKLICATRHQFTFLVQEPIVDSEGKMVRSNQTVKTASHMVHNIGKQPATNVEVVLNWKPKCVNLWPLRHYEEKIDPDNRFVMVFPSLSPGELIGIEVLDINADLPNVLNVRSDQCVARVVEMGPQRIWPQWAQKLGAFLVWMGMAATAYLFITGLQWLVLKTPA